MKKSAHISHKKTHTPHTARRASHKKQSTSIALPFFYAIAVLGLFAVLSAQVPLVMTYQSNVLGDDNENKQEQQKSEDRKQEEKSEEKQETKKESKQETKEENAPQLKIETKVETKKEDVRTKVETRVDEDLEVKYEAKEDGVEMKIENKSGKEVEVAEKEKTEMEMELELDDVKVSSTDGELEVESHNVKAKSNFPLSFDVGTNQLMVTTPDGEKTVAVLPDEAIANLMRLGMVPQASSGATLGDNSGFDGSIHLKDTDGELVYEVEGKKKNRLFGFIPVSTDFTAVVSAQNGEVRTTQLSLFAKLIQMMSF